MLLLYNHCMVPARTGDVETQTFLLTLLMGLGRVLDCLGLEAATVGVEQTRLEFLLRTCGEGRPDLTPTSLGRLPGLEVLAANIDWVKALPTVEPSQLKQLFLM